MYFDSGYAFKSKALSDLINKGIEMLSKRIDNDLLRIYQDYAKKITELVSRDLYLDYLRFITDTMMLSPDVQLKMSIERFMDYYKRLS